MLIIVEGVDGVGKTTFVDMLRNHLEKVDPDCTIDVLHKGPPTSDEMLEEYELPLQYYYPGRHHHVICDRWHIGEMVYGPLLRGSSKLDEARRLHIDLFLQSKGALIAHMTAPWSTVVSRRRQRDVEDLIEDAQVAKVATAYYAVMERGHTPRLVVDWIAGREEHWLNTITNAARRYEERSAWVEEFPTYIGNIYGGGCLLLGERRNQNTDSRWDSAFVPLPNSSGHYLLSHVTPDLVPMMGIANADEVDVAGLYSFNKPNVVALGTTAHKVLTEAWIPHGAVPHPQFIRRFHHDAGHEYAEMIREAMFAQKDLRSWRP